MNDVGNMMGTTPAGNTPGNGIDVVVPVELIQAISEWFVNTAYGFFLGKRVAYPVVANYDRNTWGKMVHGSFVIIRLFFEWNPDVDLLKEDVGNVLVWVKLHGVLVTAFSEDGLSAIATKLGTPLMLDSYTSDMCLQSWGRSSYAGVMIELRADMELKDNIVWLCLKLCGNNKKGEAHTNEVSNSNPFDALNSVDNDVEFDTNRGTTNLVDNGANSSRSYFMNVENSSTSYTPTIDKIGKFEYLLIGGQVILVDEAGNPLKNVECPGNYDSEAEVASVDNDMARSLALERVGLGTQSHDIPQEIQAICDNLDIRVGGRKKK
ncbi:hypothetical protein Tco_0178902 [Tanacetum coccineum]